MTHAPRTATFSGDPRLFGPDPAPATIQAHQGRTWLTSFMSRAAVQLIQLVTVMLLARWLAPADFGVVAMVMGVIGIGTVLRDLGLSAATVQQPHITHPQVSVLFWINAGLGLALTILACLLAPAVGWFYGDPRVTGVAALMAFSFVIGGLSAQHLALLNRSLRIFDLGRIQVFSALLSAVVALVLALKGAGYWAMAIAAMTGAAATTLLAWSVCSWRPGWPQRGAGVEPMLRFGVHLAAFGALSFVALNVHNVVLGLAEGAATVGIYNQALQLVILLAGSVAGPLTVVAIAALSRLAAQPAEYRSYYLRCLGALTALAAPLSVTLLLQAEPIIRVLFGGQWSESVLPLRILALSLVPQVLFPTTGWLLLSRGDSRGMMRWGTIGWGCHIALTLVGLQFGVIGIAAACVCSHFVLLLPTLRYAMTGTEISLTDVWSVGWRPLLASVAAAPVLVLMGQLQPTPGAVALALGVGAYLLAYALLLLSSAGERQRIRDLLTAARLRIVRD